MRTQSREMYERESRSLREARERAMDERDRAVANEREMRQKHDHLLKEYVSIFCLWLPSNWCNGLTGTIPFKLHMRLE